MGLKGFGVLILLVSLCSAQTANRPILISKNRINGPLGGEYHLEDLQVQMDGRVVYTEEGTRIMGRPATRNSYETTLTSDEMQGLAKLLDSRDVRSLPKKIGSKTQPIDFFWQKSLEIARPGGTQNIQVQNFYPFLNLHGSAYPWGLIELECKLQEVQAKASKRSKGDQADWCKDILAKRSAR